MERWSRVVGALIAAIGCLIASSPPSIAQTIPLQSAKAQSAATMSLPWLQVEVLGLRVRSRSPLNGIQGQVELHLRVHNTSTVAHPLLPSYFSFTCQESDCPWNAAIPSPLLPGTIKLPPGETRDGWIAFSANHPSVTEPRLTLSLKVNATKESINVNEAMRELAAMETIFMGPDHQLAVVQLRRNMDQVTVWLLTAEFHRLKSLGLQTVVLDLQPAVRETAASYPERRTLDSWLLSVQKGAATNRFNFANQVTSPVQFPTFFASGADSKSNANVLRIARNVRGFMGDTHGVFAVSRDEAIANAARPFYETIALARAIEDLNHPEPGIQRAVLETNIDRLNTKQLTQLIDSALTRDTSFQTLVAENLYRVAVQAGVSRLAEFVRSPTPEVSQAALRSIVKSVVPQASATLKEFWRDSQHSPEISIAMRQDIVSAIMDARDYRHLDLLTEFAQQLVVLEDGDPADTPTGLWENDPVLKIQGIEFADGRSGAVVPPHATLLQNVLKFLSEQGDTTFGEFARRHLLNISDDGIQDVVMNSILAGAAAGDERLFDEYIRQRLLSRTDGDQLSQERQDELTRRFGARNVTRSTRVTDTLLNTIRRFPSADYADRLLELSRSSALPSATRNRAFQMAVRCATDDQLAVMIAQFDGLDNSSAAHLLAQLALLDHPQWLSLATKCLSLEADESSRNRALAVLRNHASIESIEVVVGYVEALRPRVEQELQKRKVKIPNPHVLPNYRSLSAALQLLAVSTCPAARRAVNRCHRSAAEEVSKLAFGSIINFYRSNPNSAQTSRAYELRKEKNYAEALSIYDQILHLDPFYSSGYVSRASLKLRDGDADDAIADLLLAEALDPENPMIESLIAIAEVRRGNSHDGLRRAEEILESIPELPTNLWRDTCYNTACAYGRASEIADSDQSVQKYLQRGMELLEASATCEGGFDDLQHVLDDPDLNAFHQHDRWPAFLEVVKANQAKAAGQRR